MTSRISTAPELTRWSAHTALVRLHTNWNQLDGDAANGADGVTLAADKAALGETRRQITRMRGSHQIDVTA